MTLPGVAIVALLRFFSESNSAIRSLSGWQQLSGNRLSKIGGTGLFVATAGEPIARAQSLKGEERGDVAGGHLDSLGVRKELVSFSGISAVKVAAFCRCCERFETWFLAQCRCPGVPNFQAVASVPVFWAAATLRAARVARGVQVCWFV